MLAPEQCKQAPKPEELPDNFYEGVWSQWNWVIWMESEECAYV